MIQHTDRSYGPTAHNRLADAGNPTADGARAGLESFYYALNQRDSAALRHDWTEDPLAQLNNPLGGILRGGDAIAELYEKLSPAPYAPTRWRSPAEPTRSRSSRRPLASQPIRQRQLSGGSSR